MEEDIVKGDEAFYSEALEKARKLIAEGYTDVGRKMFGGKLRLTLRNKEDNDKVVAVFDEKLFVLVKQLVQTGEVGPSTTEKSVKKGKPKGQAAPENGDGDGGGNEKVKRHGGQQPARVPPGHAGEATSLFWWKEKEGQPLISSLVKKVAWFEDSIHDIGLTALFAIMQVRGVMPNEAINTFRRFADQKQFENYVIDGLEALLKGRLEAEKILDYERKLKASEVKEVWLETELILAKREKEGFRGAFKMAVNSMCSEDIRRLFEKKTYSDIIQGMIEAPQQIKVTEKEGV